MSVKKIVVLGADGVGKTSIVRQFKLQVFDENQEPGVEEKFNERITVDNKEVEIEVHDTAGTDTSTMVVRDLMMKQGDGFIIVYSITSMSSLSDTKALVEKLQEVRGAKKFPAIVVGCKLDMADSREVQMSDGEDYAKELGCPFMEISAADRQNVVDVFVKVMHEVENPPTATLPAADKKKKKGCCTVL